MLLRSLSISKSMHSKLEESPVTGPRTRVEPSHIDLSAICYLCIEPHSLRWYRSAAPSISRPPSRQSPEHTQVTNNSFQRNHLHVHSSAKSVSMHVCMRVCMYVFTSVRMHACTYVYVCMYVCIVLCCIFVYCKIHSWQN